MRLADFILCNMELIVAQWEAFAGTLLPAAANMKPPALRDHAPQILEAIAKDLSAAQTREAQLEKSRGHAPSLIDAPETAAQMHAILRARSGFDVKQLVAEYRALRASVLRLWMDRCSRDVLDMDDVIRLNEAIDQAVSESLGDFSAQVDQARNLLLGMLGHDMRSPLQTIQTTASYLVALNAGERVTSAADRLIRSGARMQSLLDDLCDFNRTKLGLGIAIAPTLVDLAAVFGDELDQVRANHPGRQLELEVRGNIEGIWDGPRLQQMLGNLVLNAIRYGAPNTVVRVVVIGEKADVRIVVANSGPTIEPLALQQIFEPLTRGEGQSERYDEGSHLGLGLYIVREIVKAHGGEIDVRSEQCETEFAVQLPRNR
ncbi:Signal transduction histidine kinase [Paraburkholderia fungorum]|uniref:histidine kinase n=1 Tax=Paraburkholderia fungorum TaxID=134537 RepID=A0A1H1JYA6_9BURK|nr:sensor histidine kinase [Paraburkholderia fungorum]SDR54647.1 Signal transduction histidine kinase [Paraburkholderia fungorum]